MSDEFSVFNEAKYVYDSISMLENLIKECRETLYMDRNIIYDFMDFSMYLFGEYIRLGKIYEKEIPLFTRAYADSAKLAFELFERKMINEGQLKNLLFYKKDVLKLQRKYAKRLKKSLKY